MKQPKQTEAKKNIWKWFAIGSVALMSVFCVIAGVLLVRGDNIAEQEQAVAGPDAQLTMETGAYLPEKKAEERKFVDQGAPEAEEGDNREVFRIIEVIPHEVCSIFPYYVDWKTEEGYDANTPLGYDGLLVAAQFANTGTSGDASAVNMFSKQNVLAKDSRPYTYLVNQYVENYFTDYSFYDNLALERDNTRGGRWVRKTLSSSTDEWSQTPYLVEAPYGYFEYVGEGKGLYYINVSRIAGEVIVYDEWNKTTIENGIHFEMQAVPRKGTEEPQGYIYVKDPAYYWSKDSVGSSMPKFDGKDVLGLTKYNYDLSFTKSNASTATYKVDKYVRSLSGGEEYEYELVLEDSAVSTWESGFYFKKGGKYQVDTYAEAANGKYVRYATSDGTSDKLEEVNVALQPGYFLLAEDDEYQGATRYNVTFKKAAEGEEGYYMPNSPAAVGANYYFEYKGKNKGTYKLSFLYAPETTTEALYEVQIQQVSNNQGRYALATTSTSGSNKEPVYDKTENVAGAVYDYAEVVTYIDANTDKVNTAFDYYNYNGIIGVGRGDTWQQGEVGGWVFVPLEKAEDMKQTYVKDIRKDTAGKNSNTDAYFKQGDRIYVTNQKRIARVYTRDGLQNNEWFKLLCYSNNPMDAEGETPYSTLIDNVGYDFEKTAEENLTNEVTEQLLEAFDSQYRIEIIQMQPQNLTVDDVKSADLIYISNQEAINGLSLHWNDLSDAIWDESLPECDFNTVYKLKPEQDISAEVLRTLYDECIYQRNRALIVCHSVIEGLEEVEDQHATRNLTKLYYMMNHFDEALNWAYFMPDWYPEVANENYSRIRMSGNAVTVDTYVDTEYEWYNIEFPEEEEEAPEPEATPAPDATPTPPPEEEEEGTYQYNVASWLKSMEYFHVFHDPITKGNPMYPFQNDIGYWANIVQEGETKLTVKYYIDPLFSQGNTMHQNIWQILRNRQLDTSVLVVEVTNGELTAETTPRRIIYADEFDPNSFDVDYKVLLLGTPKNPSSLVDITLTFEDGTVAGHGTTLEYGVENTTNVRQGFTMDGTQSGPLNPSVTMRKVTITATDSNGKTGTAEVYVVVREAFMLN